MNDTPLDVWVVDDDRSVRWVLEKALRQADFRFAHAAQHELGSFRLLDSYHCSRYNTNTRRLTEPMFDSIFAEARSLLDK